MSYCLDSSIVVALFRGDEELREKFIKISQFSDISVTYITLCELYKGAFLSSQSEKGVYEINSFLQSVSILEFNLEACKFFGQEYVKLGKAGRTTQEPDLMIASIAKVNGLTIVTRNKKHFEYIDVKMEVW